MVSITMQSCLVLPEGGGGCPGGQAGAWFSSVLCSNKEPSLSGVSGSPVGKLDLYSYLAFGASPSSPGAVPQEVS